MNKKIGFIGCGNMAKAMIGGIVGAGSFAANQVMASDGYQPSLEGAQKKYGISITMDNKEIAKECDYIVLAVKPNMYPAVIKEIADCVKEDVVIISIAAGQTIQQIEACFGKPIKLIRTMPNTPALVGEGMTAVFPNKLVSKEEVNFVCEVLRGFSKVEILDEKLIHAVIGVSGSSPAYVFMFIEAMADAAVLEGLPRDKAYQFAAQAVLGSAKMVLETGLHPGALKDMVCSPGGTTIAAVATLEETGMRNSVIKAMKDCMEKSKTM